MENSIILQAAEQLKADWQLQITELVSEEEILRQLANSIIELLSKGPEAFFQTMYRLDISEKKLNAVLHNPDVATDIARLIYNRQVQKIQSRTEYKDKNINTDPDLQW